MYFRQILLTVLVSLFVSAIMADEQESDMEARLGELLMKMVARKAQEERSLTKSQGLTDSLLKRNQPGNVDASIIDTPEIMTCGVCEEKYPSSDNLGAYVACCIYRIVMMTE